MCVSAARGTVTERNMQEAAEKLKYPKGERGWVSYYDPNGELLFIMTSKENDRSWYFLYKIENGKMVKLGKAHTPPELEKQYGVPEAMHGNAEQPKKSCRKKKVVVE